jgi:hypothetical protein
MANLKHKILFKIDTNPFDFGEVAGVNLWTWDSEVIKMDSVTATFDGTINI